MDGVGGLEGWKWIFIIEGLITIVVGVFAYFICIDDPSRCVFLDEDEKKFLALQIKYDGTRTNGTGTWSVNKAEIFATSKDPYIWLWIVQVVACSIPTYSVSYTLATIVASISYSKINAQLLSVPPYVTACIFTYGIAILGDRMNQRVHFIQGSLSVWMLGFILALALPTHQVGARYSLAMFLITSGIYSGFPPVLAWSSASFAPSTKRAIGMALVLTFGNGLGSLIGSNIYLTREKPRYWTGFGLGIAITFSGLVSATILRWLLKREKERRERVMLEGNVVEDEEVAKGDKGLAFRDPL